MPHADLETKRSYMRQYYSKNKCKLDKYKQEWKQANPDKAKEHQQKYLNKTKEELVHKRRQYRYGLSKDQFNLLVKEQNNCCALCNVSFENKRIFVDHCHATGDVRGLLCPACNTALGLIKDDVGWLAKAKQYLVTR